MPFLGEVILQLMMIYDKSDINLYIHHLNFILSRIYVCYISSNKVLIEF